MMAKNQDMEKMIEEAGYAAKRNKRIKEEEASSREYGREVGPQHKDKGYKKGNSVKKYKQGGTVSSASKRADGVAIKGKTKGRFV